jgi:hypothetical protein
MGRFAEKAQKIKEEHENSFRPLELTGGNVTAIFNRCLATDSSEEKSPIVLFPTIYGYTKEEEILVQFDKEILTKNLKIIEYLYGQLKFVHKNGFSNTEKRKGFTTEDAIISYTGIKWTVSKSEILEFLYLGCNPETRLIKPFNKKYNGTDIRTNIRPTLSPKDSKFPVWWEEHKAEWEDSPQ